MTPSEAKAVLDTYGFEMNPTIKAALSTLLVVAKDQRDELSGLKAELLRAYKLIDDRDIELARLKAPLGDEGRELVRDARAPGNAPAFKDALIECMAAYIERQAAALAAPVGDVEELATRLDGWNAACPDNDARIAAAKLRTLSRQLGEVTKGVEAVRRDVEAMKLPAAVARNRTIDEVLAILDQHVPAQGVGDAALAGQQEGE